MSSGGAGAGGGAISNPVSLFSGVSDGAEVVVPSADVPSVELPVETAGVVRFGCSVG